MRIHQPTLNIPQVLWIPCYQNQSIAGNPNLLFCSGFSVLCLSMPHIIGQDEESLWSFYYNTRTMVFLFVAQSFRKDTLQWNISSSICDEWCVSLYMDVYTVLVNCNYLSYFKAAAAWQRSSKWLLFFKDAVNTGFWRIGETKRESIPNRFPCKATKMKLSLLLAAPFQPPLSL